MHVGLDFDNTIAGYDSVFIAVARARGILNDPAVNSKSTVRTRVRALENGEEKWMALQGEVYGMRMKNAEMIPGVDSFLQACKIREIPVQIVSHKTEYGHFDVDRVNLRTAARSWMEDRGFFDADGYNLRHDDVIFESTRKEKVTRIAALGCSHFVDDLEEVFLDPAFPKNVFGVLFDPTGTVATEANVVVIQTWQEIQDLILAP